MNYRNIVVSEKSLTIVYAYVKNKRKEWLITKTKIMDVNISKIKEVSIPIIEKNNLVLYDLKVVHEFEMDIIRIMVDDPNTFDIDIDVVGKINQEILDLINDDIPDGYYLEVTSVGIEREIDISSDLPKSIEKYVFVSLYEKNQELNEKEIYGTLKSFDDLTITIDVKIKTRRKTVNIEKAKIAKMRLAVEF